MDVLRSILVDVLLLAAFLLVLVGFVLNRYTAKKTRSLREAGVYPQEGQETDGDVDRLLHLGHKIEAIRVYRTLHQVDLKDAKTAVEKRQLEIGLR